MIALAHDLLCRADRERDWLDRHGKVISRTLDSDIERVGTMTDWDLRSFDDPVAGNAPVSKSSKHPSPNLRSAWYASGLSGCDGPHVLIEEFRKRQTERLPLSGPTGERPSEREWEVLKLMAGGLPTRAIAARLGIGELTVRRHVSAVVEKLGVTDRAAAVQLFRSSSTPRPPP